jgi:hypothetical protein
MQSHAPAGERALAVLTENWNEWAQVQVVPDAVLSPPLR